jgi:toxin ParE1/3/4
LKVTYTRAALDDLIGQFRYYLVTVDSPKVAVRFRTAVRITMDSLLKQPLIGAPCRVANPVLRNLRSWPVAGFEDIRIYYSAEAETLRVARILHGKRNVRRILSKSDWQP